MEVLDTRKALVVSGGADAPADGNLAVDSTDNLVELYDKAVAVTTDLMERAADFFGGD